MQNQQQTLAKAIGTVAPGRDRHTGAGRTLQPSPRQDLTSRLQNASVGAGQHPSCTATPHSQATTWAASAGQWGGEGGKNQPPSFLLTAPYVHITLQPPACTQEGQLLEYLSQLIIAWPTIYVSMWAQPRLAPGKEA